MKINNLYCNTLLKFIFFIEIIQAEQKKNQNGIENVEKTSEATAAKISKFDASIISKVCVNSLLIINFKVFVMF